MGLFKNLFYYKMGKGLSKNHSRATGFGLMMLNIYNEELEEEKNNEIAFENSKRKAIKSFKNFYIENKEYFGNNYLNEIYKYEKKLEEMTPSNCSIIKNSVLSFIAEMDFHANITSGSLNTIQELEKLPKEDMKDGFLDNCKEMHNKIKNSIYPVETVNYWEEFVSYLSNNKVNITNIDSTRKDIYDKLKELGYDKYE